MSTLKLKTALLSSLLSILVLCISIPTVNAETQTKLTTYSADSDKRDHLEEIWGDTNADDNSKIRSAGSTWAFFHNTDDPDAFRRGRNAISRQTATGALLHSNGDIDITFSYNGISETRTVANINVNTNAVTEGAIADSAGKPSEFNITNAKYFCVLNGSDC